MSTVANSPSPSADTRRVSLSGIIGVPATILSGLLRDIHTIELYGFPHVITRCLLETFALPDEVGAIRRCTLNFGTFQGCMLREELIFSGEKSDATTDSDDPSSAREYVVQLRYRGGTDAEADRSPFGVQGRHAVLEAVTTLTITPISTSPHQCFFRVSTSLQLRAESHAAHAPICAFWRAYGRELFTAIQRYVVSKAYSPKELTHIDAVEVDAQQMMTSLEQTYMDLVAAPDTQLGRQQVFDLLELALVQTRRLLSAYQRTRLQSLAERAMPGTTTAPTTTPTTSPSQPSPQFTPPPPLATTPAQLAVRQQAGDRIKADTDALRVQTIVEMARQWDLLDDDATEDTDSFSPSGAAVPLPPSMIDMRAVPSGADRCPPLASLDDATSVVEFCHAANEGTLARVVTASRAADMAVAAPTEVTPRGALAPISPSRASRRTQIPTVTGPAYEPEPSTLRHVPLRVLLARWHGDDAVVADDDAVVAELLRRFWGGHSAKPPLRDGAAAPTVLPALAPPSAQHASSSLWPPTHTAEAPATSTAISPTTTTAAAVTSSPVEARYWTIEDVTQLLRAMDEAGSLYTTTRLFVGRASEPTTVNPTRPSSSRSSVKLSINATEADAARLPHPPLMALTAPTATTGPVESAPSSSFAAYKREAQRGFLERYSGPSADRLGSSFGGESSLANSGIGFSPSSTVNGADTHFDSPIGTNDSDMAMAFSVTTRTQPATGYFTHKLSRAAARSAPRSNGVAGTASALARVEAVLGRMETPEQVQTRTQAALQTQRELGLVFAPPLTRRELPAALQSSPASTAPQTLADLQSRQACEEAAAAERREALLAQAAAVLMRKFAYNHEGRLYADEARLALAHVMKN